MSIENRFRGCLVGLAVGDAVGTTLEFSRPGSFEPVTDMVGGGPFRLKPGQWTDDTSMALCLAVSLIECRGFDPLDQMQRYCRWRDEGYLSSTGRCFDIGTTVSGSLERFRRTGDPYAGSNHPRSAGNGSIMRLAPVVMFYYPDAASIAKHARLSSRTTHGAAECLDACQILGEVIRRCFDGLARDAVLDEVDGEWATEGTAALAAGRWRAKRRDALEGSGYVVRSLEAALWCFENTGSFEEAILAAANLGDDADTTAAICGQIAGAHYGNDAIRADWRNRLYLGAEIERYADRLRASSPISDPGA